MASTIQIKNSNVAGNAPSSLTQGELAINVKDGNLFYGDGSSVKQDFAVTNITASVISASGTIVGSNLSGTNTGDQDLTPYVQNSQTSSMSVATASYVAGGNVDGVVASATDSTNADNINVGNSDDSSTYYVAMALGTGDQPLKRDSGITFDSSANTLNVGNLDSTKVFIGASNIELRGDANNLVIYNGGLQAVGSITASNDISASGQLDAQVHHLVFNSASIDTSTNGSAVGDIIYKGNTTTVEGYVYYLNSSGGWTATDADASGSSKGMLAMALGTNSTTNGMLLRGLINPGGTGLTAANVGDPVYLSLTAGRLTGDISAYTTGDVVRIAGYQVDSDCIYFNPDNSYIVLS